MKPLDSQAATIAPAAESAFRWLLDSGIQASADGAFSDGGVYAWYDLRTDSYPFVYGEITGYAVNAYLHYYLMTGETRSLDAAKRAAACLLRNRDTQTSLFYNRVEASAGLADYYRNWVFVFDQWIIIYGLSQLAGVSNDQNLQAAAMEAAGFLLNNTTLQDGSFFPAFDLSSRQPIRTDDKWSRQPGAYHAKALLPLKALCRFSEDKTLNSAAERLAAWTVSQQQKDGRFITQTSDGSTHLHPHLYALEGLISYFLETGNKEWGEAALKGFNWVLSSTGESGQLYSVFKEGRFLPFIRADILAQALRLGAILRQQGMLQKSALDKLAAIKSRLLAYQIEKGSQKGGFLYGQEQDGSINYHANAWTTMFAAQALWASNTVNERPWDMSCFI